MMKPIGHPAAAAAALATFLVGLPAVLGAQDTYYVLTAHDDQARQVLLSVHNPTDRAQIFDLLPIASGANGALRPEPPVSLSVPAGRTMQYSNLAGNTPSMVELVAHGDLTFQAYTMPTNSSGRRVGLREQVPIVDSDNMVPGGTWAFVSGMRRDRRDRSDYAIVNLSHTSNTCEHRVRSHDGRWALESRVLNHVPLSLTYVADVLKVVGIELGDHYTISTRCTGNFYVAGLVADDDTDRITVLQPFQSVASALRRPGYDDPPPPPELPEDPPPPPPRVSCTSGWVCMDLQGAFHRATAARPSFEHRLNTPQGAYRRAVFRFKVHHGGWNRISSRNQNLFWLAREKHLDLFGFGIARGPGGPAQVFYRTDWGVEHVNKQRVETPHLMRAGETYDVMFDFDAGGGRIVLTLTDSRGAEVMRSVGRPNVSEIPFSQGQRIAVGFGFRGEYESEPAQPGWIWSDLHVELQPK